MQDLATKFKGTMQSDEPTKLFQVSRAITAALPLVDCTIRLPRYREFSFVQSKYKAAIDFTQNRKVILADITRAFPTEKPIRMPSLHWDGHLWRSLVLHLYLSGTTIYSSILPCFPNVTALDLSYKRGKFFDKDDINTIVSQLRWLKLESTDCVDDNSLSQLTNLQHLDLKYNSKITKRSVSWLTGLTSLNLSYNHNVKDNVVVHFTKLQSLWLDSNGTVTDAAVSTLTSLTLLDLQYNENITDKSVAMLTDLVSLNLENNNQISQEVVKRLPRLKRIRVKHNSRISPDQLLKALKELK